MTTKAPCTKSDIVCTAYQELRKRGLKTKIRRDNRIQVCRRVSALHSPPGTNLWYSLSLTTDRPSGNIHIPEIQGQISTKDMCRYKYMKLKTECDILPVPVSHTQCSSRLKHEFLPCNAQTSAYTFEAQLAQFAGGVRQNEIMHTLPAVLAHVKKHFQLLES